MATFSIRKPIETAAWSGGATHVQRLLAIVFEAFDSEKTRAREKVLQQAESQIGRYRDEFAPGDKLAAGEISIIENRRDRELEDIEEAFSLRVKIDDFKSETTTTGGPDEVIDKLDDRVRQNLTVRCPGYAGTLYTEKSISLSMKTKYGVSADIEGDDRDWVSGVHERLLQEAVKQVPRDAWLLKWWARSLVVIATCSIVATLAWITPASLGWKATIAVTWGLGASLYANSLIDKINRFELLAPGKAARANRTWGVLVFFAGSVLSPVLLYLFTGR